MSKKNINVHAITHKVKGIARNIVTPVEITDIFSGKNVKTQGIWDTGATGSVITKATATDLGLQSYGKRKVRGVHGLKDVDEYFVNITLNNKNITLNTRVTECSELSADGSIGLLIGMNVITTGDFAVTNYQGDTTMSFRVPSMENIDFLAEMKSS